MEISISEKLWDRIQQKVDSGDYPSVEVVLTNAMILLDHHDALAVELTDSPEVRARIAEGVADLKNGRYTTYTDETLHELFDDVKRRGRERRAARYRWLVG